MGTSSSAPTVLTPAQKRERAEKMVEHITYQIDRASAGVDVRVNQHVGSHQAIFKLGGSTLHHLGESKTARHVVQHGYAFKPAYAELLESDNPSQSRSLLYMVPNNTSKKQKKLYYIAIPKKKEEQKAEDALFEKLRGGGDGTGTGTGTKEGEGGEGGEGEGKENRDENDDEGSFIGNEEKDYAEEDDEGLSCPLCTTMELNDPWINSCGHIACGDCWSKWIEENGGQEVTCPECDAPVHPETLKSVDIEKLNAERGEG